MLSRSSSWLVRLDQWSRTDPFRQTVNLGTTLAALIHLSTDRVEALSTTRVHSHSLVPLAIVDRWTLGITGSVADLAGLTPTNAAIALWQAKQPAPAVVSRPQAGSLTVHDTLAQHAPDRPSSLLPRRRTPFSSEYSPSSPLHRYLVAGDSRGPTCVTNHFRSPPLDRRIERTAPSPAPRAPLRLLAVPSPPRNTYAVEQRRLQIPRVPLCCHKNRCRPSCRPRRSRGRTSPSIMPHQ